MIVQELIRSLHNFVIRVYCVEIINYQVLINPTMINPADHNATRTVNRLLRILIIEDSSELAYLLSASLKTLACKALEVTVEIARTGTEGLEAIYARQPDLVLLDIGLPDMTGWRVLDAIHELPDQERCPAVIMITAYGDPANRVMGKLQGVNAYLTKPVLPRDVTGLIKSWLDCG
jgi:CheY-like chemotaxis protein